MSYGDGDGFEEFFFYLTKQAGQQTVDWYVACQHISACTDFVLIVRFRDPSV